MNRTLAFAMAAVIASAAPLFAQTTSPKPAKAHPHAQATHAAPMTDEHFVKDSGAANMAEVELGRLAATKASREEVKKFGQQMVDEHEKANDELKTIAKNKNIALPETMDAAHKAVHDRLARLSGAAFDRSYMREMVAGHRKVAAEFRTESSSGKDNDVKAYAAKMLPTIEQHLKEAEGLSSTAVGTSGRK
jgi:putative membrane protein